MGIKKIELLICDKCGKEIKGRLTTHACPICHADICLSCQEKEDARHKPRERKQKTEQASVSPAEVVAPLPKKHGRQPSKKKPITILGSPDISTFSIKTPQPGHFSSRHAFIGTDELYTLSLGEVAVASTTVKEGAQNLLLALGIDQKYVKDAPDSEGKRNLLGILKEKIEREKEGQNDTRQSP